LRRHVGTLVEWQGKGIAKDLSRPGRHGASLGTGEATQQAIPAERACGKAEIVVGGRWVPSGGHGGSSCGYGRRAAKTRRR
jgi:hypothetical protein